MYISKKIRIEILIFFCLLYVALFSFSVYSLDNLNQTIVENNQSINYTSNILNDTNIYVNSTIISNSTTYENNQTNISEVIPVNNQTNISESIINQTNISESIINQTNIINETKDKTTNKKTLISESSRGGGGSIQYFTVNTQSSNAIITSGNNPVYFVSDKNNLLYRISPDGEIIGYFSDTVGNIRGSFDSLSNQLDKKNYLIFGEQIENAGYNFGKAYLNKESKNLLYYFGARYYNALTGRFVSVDPVYDPTTNPYSYAKENPLKYKDPDGRKPVFSDYLRMSNQRSIEIFGVMAQSVSDVKKFVISDSNKHYFVERYEKDNLGRDIYNRVFEVSSGPEPLGVTVSNQLSIIDMSKTKDDFGSKNSDLIGGYIILHEAYHQAISEKNHQTAGKDELKEHFFIQEKMTTDLGFSLSYNDQINNKNSWVSKAGLTEKEYNLLNHLNEDLTNYYKSEQKERDNKFNENKITGRTYSVGE